MKKRECKLEQDCIGDHCGRDVYKLPGYFNGHALELNGGNAFDMEIKDSRVFWCDFPNRECKHDIQCLQDWMEDEIEKNSGDDPVDLVSLCYGGLVAQKYASEHPEKVDKLVLINSYSDLDKVALGTELLKTRRFFTGNFRKKLDMSDVKVVKDYDFEEIGNNIKSNTFVYNCFADSIIAGSPPKIPSATEEVTDFICLHGRVPKRSMDKITSFLDG